MIAISNRFVSEDGLPTPKTLRLILSLFEKEALRMDKLHRMHARSHEINHRKRLKNLPNNRLCHDLPGYIVTMASGYLVGSPIVYQTHNEDEEAFDALQEALRLSSADNVDAELAASASIYGKGIEIVYADSEANPRIAQLDSRSAFVVYDDSVEHRPLFGVVLQPILDDQLQPKAQSIHVYTARVVAKYERNSTETPTFLSSQPHYFGDVPITEYWNNAKEQGDFEPVISLIDAYDALQSDRINDKQQFTDSILAFYGTTLSGDDFETVDQSGQKIQTETPSERLRRTKMLEMPASDAKVEYITKPQTDSETEILRQSLKSDIHKLSMIPDLTDERFAGNVSGVAMKFKLLGLEQLTKIKERWFREGLTQRLKLFAHFLEVKGFAKLDIRNIRMVFHRSLPVNELETAQTLMAYQGLVPDELLLGQVPFVEDVKAAFRMKEAEDKRPRL